MSTIDIDTDDHVERRLVAPHLELSRAQAVQRLAEVLEQGPFSEAGAKAVASATCDAAGFRRALDNPLTVRVPGGVLHMVHTRLWTPGVVLHPTNTRISPWMSFAFAGAPSSPPLPRPTPDALGRPQLDLTVPSPDELVRAVSQASTLLESENYLDDDIAAHSIREAITVVVITVHHEDQTDAVTLLAAVDGSSRVSAAHRNLHIRADAALYRYAGNAKALRERVGRTLRLQDLDRGQIDQDDIAQLNSLSVPALVVVGFDADPDQGGIFDFSRAIDARVGNIHVNPPKVWSEAARLDAQLNAVLDELSEEWLTDDELAYFAGHLSPDDADALDLTELPDVRAAHVLSYFHDPKVARIVHQALRSLGLPNVNYSNRADVAAEAALRSFRSNVTAQEASAARLLLRHLYKLEVLRSEWDVERDRSLEELRDAALSELRETGPKPAIAELAAYAVFWLARNGIVRRATRGKDTDRTDIGTVVAKMASSPWGIQALYRIVADSRAGEPIKRVDRSGRIVQDDEFSDMEDWIRSIWGRGGRDQEVLTPEVELDRARADFEERLRDAGEAFKKLLEPKVDGAPLIESVGVSSAWADRLLGLCTEIQGDLVYYRRIGRRTID